eukprot:524456_1
MAHDTMASVEHTEISKQVLENVHRRQLTNGESNSVHHEAIIEALGGIDEILQHLFASNVVLEQQQLDSLHHIITNASHKNQQTTTINAVSQQQEDNTYHHAFTYTFKDEDSFLFTIFGEENGAKILHILSGKIIICVLSVLFGLFVIAFFLGTFSVVSWDVANAFLVVFYLFCSMYIIMWILYANKEAMKLLFRQFVFWFKISYLFIYLVTNTVVRYLDGRFPSYFIWVFFIFYATLVFIVMIFDAINAQKSTKIIISSLAVGIFAMRTSDIMVNTFYADEWDVYDRAIVTFNIPYVDDKARISIVDMCSNTAQILAIFLFKQLISFIRNPNKALVITTKPLIEYANNKETSPTIKNVKIWRRVTIVFWTIGLLVWIVSALPVLWNEESHVVHITLWIMFIVILIIGLCVVTVAPSKFHWILHIIVLVEVFIYGFLILLFRWGTQGVLPILIQFGLTAVYTLKVSEMNKMNGSTQSVQHEKDLEDVISHHLPNKGTSTLQHASMDMDDANMEKIAEILTEEIEMQMKPRREESISDQKVSESNEMDGSAQSVM